MRRGQQWEASNREYCRRYERPLILGTMLPFLLSPLSRKNRGQTCVLAARTHLHYTTGRQPTNQVCGFSMSGCQRPLNRKWPIDMWAVKSWTRLTCSLDSSIRILNLYLSRLQIHATLDGARGMAVHSTGAGLHRGLHNADESRK